MLSQRLVDKTFVKWKVEVGHGRKQVVVALVIEPDGQHRSQEVFVAIINTSTELMRNEIARKIFEFRAEAVFLCTTDQNAIVMVECAFEQSISV